MIQNIAKTACNVVQGHASNAANRPHYRAEFNPLSCRWMVLSDTDVCITAGLSHDKAESIARDMMN